MSTFCRTSILPAGRQLRRSACSVQPVRYFSVSSPSLLIRRPGQSAPRSNNDTSKRINGPSTPSQGLATLLQTLSELKSQSRKPTPAAYLALIRAAGDYALRRGVMRVEPREGVTVDKNTSLGLEIALGALRDAEKGGVELGTEAIDLLFRFTSVHPDILPSLLVTLVEIQASTPSAYHALARAAKSSSNLEQLVIILFEMLEQNMTPGPALVKHIIRSCCEWGNPRLAHQIVQRLDALPGTPKSDLSTWSNILTASADNHYLEGVEAAWGRIVQSKAFTPDEGLLLAVLGIAGRWGRTELASQALELLPTLSIKPQEHHMAPLIEAFCREGRVPEAMKVVHSIRSSGIIPTMATVQPIVAVLTDTEVVDQAFYALEDMFKEGTPIDVSAFNAVIEASARLGDLQRVRATQIAASDLGVTPNIDTFNIALSACVTASHRALGDTILSEMANANITPDGTTFERMILLCLSQSTYEDAFYYLEKMKAEGFKPSVSVYNALARKCSAYQDSRWKLVVEEMGQLGYKVEEDATERRPRNDDGNRRRNSGTSDRKERRREDEKERQAGRRRSTDAMVGEKRRQWQQEHPTQ